MKSTFVLFMLFVIALVHAQDLPQNTSVDDMHARKWNYLVEKIPLSREDADLVKPIFLEYENAVWKIIYRNKLFFSKLHHHVQDMNEANYQKINDLYVTSEIQKSHLLKTYYGKLRNCLKASTIQKYFKAERSFRNELVAGWQKGHRRK
ncbi:MAG: hypothetical protein AUK44_06900 [Porphyromonadaceae bacterium CG2_30_38_12]|nr:MAG: hypothetical protein AUK44_06900 [Porphyromonadaceae bacterium CG2_30_38_12]